MDLVDLDPRQDPDLADHLLHLQLRSYALEAELIGDDRIPALHETVADIKGSTLAWLGVRDGGTVIAALGYDATADVVDIDRLVVDPAHLRRGAGRMLVLAVKERAQGRFVTVSTGAANRPARLLYELLGFTRLSDEEVVPGLSVTRYRWTSGSDPGSTFQSS